MKRLQIYYPEELLHTLRIYAKSRGIPLAEAIREGSREFVEKRKVKTMVARTRRKTVKREKNPFLAMAGILPNGPTDASMTVDDIYDDV